jgi:DNA-binding GntR family transcriptional regulator
VKGRSGTTVTDIDATDLEHLFALRGALEDLAAETAVKAVTPADISRIDALIADMRRTSVDDPHASGAGPDFARANAFFHAAVVGKAHNPFLDRAYGQLQLQFQIVAYRVWSRFREGPLADESRPNVKRCNRTHSGGSRVPGSARAKA